MELESLKRLLGVNQVKGGKGEVLPPDKWELLEARSEPEHATRLMQAAGDGALDCVELLLSCGADADARDRKGNMAIDYSVSADRPEATLFLLRHDSILPCREDADRYGRLRAVVDRDEGIRRFFADRDGFHGRLKEGTVEAIEEYISKTEVGGGSYRRWVNSSGESALYTAAKESRCEAWALLRSKGFVYATLEEQEDMEAYESDESFQSAIGRYFVELGGCHVEKMVAKSKVYGMRGVDRKRSGEKVVGFFRDIDREEVASLILQCLQDDPSLEVIFDFSSTDIHCMKPSGDQEHIWGLTDFKVRRIYVAAMESEEFDHSDVVSNLVHELAHYAMAVVFENGGLPYRKGDQDSRDEYRDSVKMLSSHENREAYDEILRRALTAEDLIEFELIVRVPEMVVKHNDRIVGKDSNESGQSILERQAPELLRFYEDRVVPEIEDYISRNKTASMAVRNDLLNATSLLTSYYSGEIRVVASIGEVQTMKHNHLVLVKVSNLTLGVSHLGSKLKEVTFVDWTKYQSAGDYFNTALVRNEIKTLAVVWDQPEKPQFCRSSVCNNMKCVARQLEKVVHHAILLVPKKFSLLRREEKCIDYTWHDLSNDTKDWMLDKTLVLQGKPVTLRNIVGSVSAFDGEVEGIVDQILDADDISTLIDDDHVLIGRPIYSILKDRISELLREHPECYIPRYLRLRPVEFTQEVFENRLKDVFFVMNANKRELEKVGVREVTIWEANSEPGNARCYILSVHHHQGNEDDLIAEVFRKFRDSPNGGPQEKTKWNIVHFFRFVEQQFVNLYSLNCRHQSGHPGKQNTHIYSGVNLFEWSGCGPNEPVVIADAPGSGKSLFMHKTALEVRKKYPESWIDVVELPLYQNRIREWREDELKSKDRVMYLLYELIKMGDSAIERKLLQSFSVAEKKVVFFDGFDEICPSYRTNFTLFLDSLVSSTCVKIFLTTRLHESSDLERHLKTFAYSFLPFNKSEQVRFINLEWNASLRSMEGSRWRAKIESITSALKEQEDLRGNKEISELIKHLARMGEGKGDPEWEVNFKELAEELMKFGRSVVDGEGELSETPLHTWMLAYVAFERDFHFEKFNYLSELYKQFVEIKINIYSKDKAKASDNEAADSMMAGFKKSAYDLLKHFSANIFLERDYYNIDFSNLHSMLRVGFVAQRDKSAVFVHRTFGEYFFSLWLIEKAHEMEVTKAWLGQVLLWGKFEKVRQFINSLLLSEYQKEVGDKVDGVNIHKTLLNNSAFGSEVDYVTSTQKCLFNSILECNEGVFKFLVESSKECLPEVIFGKISWEIKILDVEMSNGACTKLNALSLVGRCICGEVNLQKSRNSHTRMEYLKFLPKMLQTCFEDADEEF